ncbi:MAG: LPS-assembly protein LptD [Gammaproteobacteria bacterium]|nr:LPS-assembly protein LptD [Gammaproteobacteria bacterium]
MRNPMRHKHAVVTVVLLGLSLPAASRAATLACVPDTLPHTALKKGADAAALPIDLEADTVERAGDGPIVLTGAAVVSQGNKKISGKTIRYDQQADQLDAEGDVELRTSRGDRIRTPQLEYQLETGIGKTGSADFEMAKTGIVKDGRVELRGRGSASTIHLEGEGLTRLVNAVFSPCVKGKDDVILRASELQVDQNSGVGRAKHVRVEFLGVPLFYAPTLSFPISDERKTGFLAPTFGSEADSGFVLGIPYYWNLAPNRDATLTPRFYANRGLMLEGEFRYLGKNYNGSLAGAWLPGDDQFGNEDRHAVSILHDHRLGKRTVARLQYQDVSDRDYFDDFSNDFNVASATFLPQTLAITHFADKFTLSADALLYQPIDESISVANEPQERLPRLTFRTTLPNRPNRLNYGLDAEFTSFHSDVRVEGNRLDATPWISYPLEAIYGFVNPKFRLRHTSYSNLNNIPAGNDEAPSRTASVFSLDSGLFFERQTHFRGRDVTHTLEPRAYYLFASNEDHSDFPIFDTAVLRLNNFSHFFYDNRFVGRDVVGDDNRVTLALTSRLIDNGSGREMLRASIGQIYYFEDRQIGGLDTSNSSDIIAEVKGQLSDYLSLETVWQWDNQLDEMREARVFLNYHESRKNNAYVAYRFARDSREQMDANINWQLAPRWSVHGRSVYDLRNSKQLNTALALEYDACCWALRVGAQRRVSEDGGFRNAIFVQLELSGLTSIRTGF